MLQATMLGSMLVAVQTAKAFHFGDITRGMRDILRERSRRLDRNEFSTRNLLDAYEADRWEETYQFLLEGQETLRAAAQSEHENFIARCINRANQLGRVAVWDYDYEEHEEFVSFVHPDNWHFHPLIGEPGAFAALKS